MGCKGLERSMEKRQKDIEIVYQLFGENEDRVIEIGNSYIYLNR